VCFGREGYEEVEETRKDLVVLQFDHYSYFQSMPFIPSTFAKIDKAASDLLKADDFDLNKKVSVAAKGDNGLTVTSSITDKGTDGAVGNIKIERKDKKTGEVTAEADTAQLLSLTWKTPEFLTKGLKAEIKGKHDHVKGKLDCFVSAEDTYTRENFTGTFLLKVGNPSDKDKKASVSLSSVFLKGFERFSAVHCWSFS
jgi:hypothetical protein